MQTTKTEESLFATEKHLFTEWHGIPLAHTICEDKIEVVVGTGKLDTDHGAHTVLILRGANGAKVEEARVITATTADTGIVFVVAGDEEARSLANALEFAASTIKRQISQTGN